MAVLLAYIVVVLIWATTPLTIQWSSDRLSFIAAVSLRMSFALAIGLMINVLMRRSLFSQPQVWRVYIAGAIGVFPNLPVVYWSAQFIPSGLVAVIFAMTPFVTGVMSFFLLKHNPFSVRRFLALLMAVIGLVIIFHQQLQLGANAVYGICGILLSCLLFSFSSVLVKKHSINVDAFNQTLGSLLFALPGMLWMWWFMDGVMPTTISFKSITAISYLVLFGSLLGSTLFFYVLRNMSPTAVSLITLMTPVLALMLGAWMGHEKLSVQLWAGASLVVLALLLYLDIYNVDWFYRVLRRNSLFYDESFYKAKNSFWRFK